MELLLFTGFLGSGKTTLILALAKRLAAAAQSTAIIVNEVGEIGIDQNVMRDGGLEVFEITSGCICCQIGVDLVRTLQTLEHDYHPQWVIVEASGVATPSGVLENLRYFKGSLERVRTIGLVDPTRLQELLEVLTPLIERQITEADRLVITKADEASSAEMAYARTEVGRLSPATPLDQVAESDESSVSDLTCELLGLE